MNRASKRLIWISANFLIFATATRVGLGLFSDESLSVGQWARIMGTGLIFDVTVLTWILLPWAIYEALVRDRKPGQTEGKWENIWAASWGTLYLAGFAITAVAEFAFWGEFGSRFDFIAVDYLVYTHEVIGNIRESYPVFLWLSVIGVICALITWFTWPRPTPVLPSGWTLRLGRIAAVGCVAVLGLFAVNQRLAEDSSNAVVTQLSENGLYAFGHAYRHNQLDYDKYYPSLSPVNLDRTIRQLVSQPNSRFREDHGIERQITAHNPKRNTNVILISVESLSAEYMGRFGNRQHLTPELDRLADQGLLFTNMYATGTRTVRGLEALSIGTPPTPGQSIVRRPNNSNVENLGEELAENGWKAFWIYGGYGLFDNMNAYFGSNGYEVVDRTNMESEGLPIHSENIWGIADEDLFALATAKLDRQYETRKPFFAHIMTTSNHRPYTFPENRVDLPQGHREGAVKYTDWAIGDFIRRSADKPWFKDTLFIIIADHTAKAAGKSDLPPWRYHIPMIWYAPDLISPGQMPRLMSQIDVGSTLMGWLGISHTSRFFGYDMFTLEAGRERAFISTYQKLGYLKNDRLVLLDVNHEPEVSEGLKTPTGTADQPSDQQLINEAIAWYQSASLYFRNGQLKDVSDADELAHHARQGAPAGE
jgi:phosphoglycerol transferase MdoB-like AlkP superfamily enzyme